MPLPIEKDVDMLMQSIVLDSLAGEWETPPNDITYKLELLEEYEGTMLSEQELSKHGFNGGRSLEVPCCNNKELMSYIKTIF